MFEVKLLHWNLRGRFQCPSYILIFQWGIVYVCVLIFKHKQIVTWYIKGLISSNRREQNLWSSEVDHLLIPCLCKKIILCRKGCRFMSPSTRNKLLLATRSVSINKHNNILNEFIMLISDILFILFWHFLFLRNLCLIISKTL